MIIEKRHVLHCKSCHIIKLIPNKLEAVLLEFSKPRCSWCGSTCTEVKELEFNEKGETKIMTIEITYECLTCLHKNRQELGMPSFVPVDTIFNTFTDAWLHCNDKYDHDIRTVVTINENEK